MDGASAVPRSAHLVLRESTRAAHDAAEASPRMRRLLAGELDEAGYRELLMAQWRLLCQWETERADWLHTVVLEAGWIYASRSAALERDLGSVGAHLCAMPLRPHATGPGEPRTHNPATPREKMSRPGPLLQREWPVGAASAANNATAWGELYVIEGSALGGRLIVQHLRRWFPSLPHHYFSIDEESSSPWRHFQAILDAALADEATLRDAVNGAQRMFARFQQTLQDDAAHG